jgi:hypothetical protein
MGAKLGSLTLREVKEYKMGSKCSTNGKKRNTYTISVGNPEGKRPLGRPTCRWVDNIKMDLRDIGWCGNDWVYVAQERKDYRVLVNTVMNVRAQ